MANPLLDTNIIIRHLMDDNPDQSPRATALMQKIENGELQVYITDSVIFEAVYVLQSVYQIPRDKIRNALIPLIELPDMIMGRIVGGKARFRKILKYYIDLNISFADAYHVVTAEVMKIDAIISYDEGLSRVKTIKRVEP
jgi:predicted nucleic acid-binding protein